MTQQRRQQLLSSQIHQLSHTMIQYSFCQVRTELCKQQLLTTYEQSARLVDSAHERHTAVQTDQCY